MNNVLFVILKLFSYFYYTVKIFPLPIRYGEIISKKYIVV